MMDTSSSEQQQMSVQKKGWLSRWTRKQWSRHWFVLKNGSLTYYRGQAAEMCSFLDGVLDLSLIKHIEVPQDEPATPATTASQQHQQQQQQPMQQQHSYQHHSYLHYHGSNQHHQQSSGQQQQQQFTFTLKMWNGECHVLGAPSAAERSLWLEAINLSTSDGHDDETATDSASSSDSSPTSNLSARSADICSGVHPLASYSLASYGLMRSSARSRATDEQVNGKQPASQSQEAAARVCSSDSDVVIQRQSRAAGTAEGKQWPRYEASKSDQQAKMLNSESVLLGNSNKLSSQNEAGLSNKKLVSSQVSSAAEATSPASKQQHTSDNQALKRRLISVLGQSYQERQPLSDLSHHHQLIGTIVGGECGRAGGRDNEMKLVGRHRLHPRADLYARSEPAAASREQRAAPTAVGGDEELAMSVVTDSSEEDDVERDNEDGGSEKKNATITNNQLEPSNGGQTCTSSEYQSPLRGCDESLVTTPVAMRVKQSPNQAPRKRVTFDLSLSSLHQLTASSASESGSSCTSSSASDSSGSSLSSSPSISSDDDDEEADEAKQSSPSDETSAGCSNSRMGELEIVPERLGGARAPVGCEAGTGLEEDAQDQLITIDDDDNDDDQDDDDAHSLDYKTLLPLDGAKSATATDAACRERLQLEIRRRDELEAKLAEAQANVSLLETKLHGSYANCGQLELTCQRLRAELEKCQEAHKSDTGRLKLRVDELSRELVVKEAKLVEARDKMVKYEELLGRQQQLHQHTQTSRSASKALNCWLKQVSQQAALNGGQQQPLLQLNQIKQTLHSAATQQHVGLKLLSHSKQIQKKLNELELKVDKIQSASFENHHHHHRHHHGQTHTTTTASLVN